MRPSASGSRGWPRRRRSPRRESPRARGSTRRPSRRSAPRSSRCAGPSMPRCSSESTTSTASSPPTTATTIPCAPRWTSSASVRADPMIEVQGLRVVLPPHTVAVDGVDLVVDPGEFVVILGRSGAGKTTFLRALNRLVEPTAGTVRVAGRAVTGAGRGELREIRRQIGMVFQQFNLVRRASVLENVLAGRLGYVPSLPSLLGRFPHTDRELAHACLAQVGLSHLADRRADTLSGGEQQRVAIARALAQRPAVI